MPCDQIRLVGVELKIASFALLVEGLKADGWKVSAQTNPDRLWASKADVSLYFDGDEGMNLRTYDPRRNLEEIAGTVRTAYARAAISYAAKKHGFNVSAKPGVTNKLTLKRRA